VGHVAPHRLLPDRLSDRPGVLPDLRPHLRFHAPERLRQGHEFLRDENADASRPGHDYVAGVAGVRAGLPLTPRLTVETATESTVPPIEPGAMMSVAEKAAPPDLGSKVTATSVPSLVNRYLLRLFVVSQS